MSWPLLGTHPEVGFIRQLMLYEHETHTKVVVMLRGMKSSWTTSDTFHQRLTYSYRAHYCPGFLTCVGAFEKHSTLFLRVLHNGTSEIINWLLYVFFFKSLFFCLTFLLFLLMLSKIICGSHLWLSIDITVPCSLYLDCESL